MKSLRYALVILLTASFTNACAQGDTIYIFNKQLNFTYCPDLQSVWCGFSTVISIPSKDKRFRVDSYFFGFDNVDYVSLDILPLKDFEKEISLDSISLIYMKDIELMKPYEFHETLSLSKNIYLVTNKNSKYVCYRVYYEGTAKNVSFMKLD
ncbi:MAG: hypothetical protein RQ756_02265 [Flavobacteriaceae bacterium]|nr:hypothetical protein [Flavobacteriaceae bacterium]